MVIRPFTAVDYPVVSRIASALRPDAPWTAAQLHRADQTGARYLKTGGFLAEQGRALGFVRYTQYADYYQPEKVVLFGGVVHEFRRRGTGRRLLQPSSVTCPRSACPGCKFRCPQPTPPP